jgi:phosphoribosyl-ATP pyrophosphohydrolase/phosphoribosyl-AMP cyclohydrolase
VNERPWITTVKFGPDGLVPVVAQDVRSGDVLMLAYANAEALGRTVETGEAHYFSRSRSALWRKGETSGHVQYVDEIRLDCDADTVLYRVRQTGPACHTGTRTCFSGVVAHPGGGRGTGQAAAADADTRGTRRAEAAGVQVLTRLAGVVAARAADRPEDSYTARLLEKGIAKISQKVGEEAVEVVVAAHAESDERLASETADLLYHLIVLFQARNVSLDRVWEELEARSR